MRVGKTVAHVNIDLLRLRLVPEDSRVDQTGRRAVGGFDLRMVEGPFLKIDRAAGIKLKAVGCVVGVGRVDPGKDTLLDIGVVIAVGVLEKKRGPVPVRRSRRRWRTRTR